jgi:hypothetical protein
MQRSLTEWGSLLEFLKQDSINKDTALVNKNLEVKNMWHDYSSLKKEYTQSLDDSLNVGATTFDTTPVQLEFWKGIQISREVVDFVQVVKDWENGPYLVLTFFFVMLALHGLV